MTIYFYAYLTVFIGVLIYAFVVGNKVKVFEINDFSDSDDLPDPYSSTDEYKKDRKTYRIHLTVILIFVLISCAITTIVWYMQLMEENADRLSQSLTSTAISGVLTTFYLRILNRVAR